MRLHWNSSFTLLFVLCVISLYCFLSSEQEVQGNVDGQTQSLDRIGSGGNNPGGEVEMILVIPGGGSGGQDGYPPWTKVRTEAAFAHYQRLVSSGVKKSAIAFIALSAGSMNVGSRVRSDGRIIFECQPVIRHLVNLGVDSSRVFGDPFSWDTLTNGLTLRMYVEAILNARKTTAHSNDPYAVTGSPLSIEVFISDFHAARMEASFKWLLGLSPSLTPQSHLVIHPVSSSFILSDEEMIQRRQHEKKGVMQIQHNQENIKSMAEFYAFVLMGGHMGFHQYLSGQYVSSTTAGYLQNTG